MDYTKAVYKKKAQSFLFILLLKFIFNSNKTKNSGN